MKKHHENDADPERPMGWWRKIYERAIKGKRINAASVMAEFVFWRLHLIADDFGTFEADPETIKDEGCPKKRQVSVADVAAALDELDKLKLIRRFQSRGDDYGVIIDFIRLQSGRRNGMRFQKFPFAPGMELPKLTREPKEPKEPKAPEPPRATEGLNAAFEKCRITDRPTIEMLIRDHPADRLLLALETLATREGVENPAGLLITMLAEGFTPATPTPVKRDPPPPPPPEMPIRRMTSEERKAKAREREEWQKRVAAGGGG